MDNYGGNISSAFNYADSLSAAQREVAAGKPGKAFPLFLLSVQLLKDAAEKEKSSNYGNITSASPTATSADGGSSVGTIKASDETANQSTPQDVLDSIEATVVSLFRERSISLLVRWFASTSK